VPPPDEVTSPVASNFSTLVAVLVGVIVMPIALVADVSRLIPAWDVLPLLLVSNGTVQVEPRVQV
jgi:hypothetical protein